MKNLEQLCRPLLRCMCDYRQYSDAGNLPDKELFSRKINMLLSEAKEDAAKSPTLEKEFSRIERPLIFFIDYMVKEGNFPFSREWRELARNYNELSGDEKFFDMLSEALDDPDSGKALEVFYTMLGLGFDGIYRNNPEYIERRMKVCASRFSQDKFDVSNEVITPVSITALQTEQGKKANPIKTVKSALIFCAVFMIAAFAVNLSAFLNATEPFRRTLFVATDSAVPKAYRNSATYNAVDNVNGVGFLEKTE